MNTEVQQSRHWHAKFHSGEQILADYFPDDDRLEIWYSSGPGHDWEQPTHTTMYGHYDNLRFVRKWAPHFKNKTHSTLLVYHPVNDTMTVQLTVGDEPTFTFVEATPTEFAEELPEV